MNTPDNTEPASATSALGLWTLLRIAGIIVGVAALLRLALISFGIEYKEFFQAFLDNIANIVELGFLLDPLEKLVQAALDWLRGISLPIPELQPHWRPIFTLAWLFLGAYARNYPADAITFRRARRSRDHRSFWTSMEVARTAEVIVVASRDQQTPLARQGQVRRGVHHRSLDRPAKVRRSLTTRSRRSSSPASRGQLWLGLPSSKSSRALTAP